MAFGITSSDLLPPSPLFFDSAIKMVTVDLTPPPGVPFNPTNQTSYILAPDGVQTIKFNTAVISTRYHNATSLSILYGTQIGACFIMLVVLLAMTPRVRFRRVPTLINIAALVLNTIRMVLLAVFFTSSFLNFFVLAAGSTRYVEPSAFNLSATVTVLSIPVTMLILAALFVQAWSMLRLWPALYKVSATLVSVGLVLTTVAFNMLTTITQTRAIIGADRNQLWRWARQTYLSLITASICWFCFLFNVRLVMHMWTNRSILPSLKGLKAMDVLVITNGVLMFVPGLSSPSHPSQTITNPLTSPCSHLRRHGVRQLGRLRIRQPHPDLRRYRPPAGHPRRATPRQPRLVRHRARHDRRRRHRLGQQHGLLALGHVGRHGRHQRQRHQLG